MELITAWGIDAIHLAKHELLLVAAVGIFLLGIEDLLFDTLWLTHRQKRRGSGPAVTAQATMAANGTMAIFVPAWQEADVLPETLRRMIQQWRNEDIRIYVGCYPNDGETLMAVSALVAANDKLRLVVAGHDGPTSKADNLNQMWQALGEDERAEATRFEAIILHDAEDLAHADELSLFRRHLPGAAMVQLPVEPLMPLSWDPIAAHYADEFAESHGKEMPLRAAFGAGLPSAGVGCAFSRHALRLLALERTHGPFNADSLTEDYEMGLILGASGAQCRFVREWDANGHRIATRSAFPSTLEDAVRQKSRWIAGIALAGWDRLDWAGRGAQKIGDASQDGNRAWLTRWMLWRDRRSPLAALIVLAAYASLFLTAIDLAANSWNIWPATSVPPAWQWLLVANAFLLVLRLALRAGFTANIYGWRHGLAAVPRAFFSNIILMLATRRALSAYLRQLQTQQLVWEKTQHRAHQPAATAQYKDARL